MNKEDLLNELTRKYNWSRGTFDVWEKASFRCSYCDQDLFHSLDMYKQGTLDHLLPQSQYANLVDDPLNQVLSCRVCNNLKRNVDLNSGLVESGATKLTEDQSKELLRRSRHHVRRARLEREQKFMDEKKLVWEWLMND